MQSRYYKTNTTYTLLNSFKEPQNLSCFIAQFLGYELSNEEIDFILSQRLQNEDEKGRTKFEGVIGDWQNYFSPEQNRRYDEIFRATFNDTSFDLSFDASDAMRRLRQHGRIIYQHENNQKGKRKKSVAKAREVTPEELTLLRKRSLAEFKIVSKSVNETPKQNEKSAWFKYLLYRIFPCILYK